MNKVRGLCIIGVILIALGASLIAIVETAILAGVREIVIIDTNAEWKDFFQDINSDYYINFWNCTNLRDVLENVGVKPHFKEVSYEMKYVEDNYDMHWHNNREEFTYKSWWTYLPVNDEVEERLDSDLIIQVNAVYMAAIADLGDSEQIVFAGLSSLAVQEVDNVLDSYLHDLQIRNLFDFLSSQASKVEDIGLIGLAWAGMIESDITLTNLGLECTSETLFNSHLNDLILAWNSSNSIYILSNYDELYAAPVETAIKSGDTTGGDNNIVSCLVQVAQSDAAAQFAVNGTMSWEDVKGAQFGQGLASLTSSGHASLLAEVIENSEGLVVAPELYGAYETSLTIEESIQFLEVFSDQTLNVNFATTLLTSDNPLAVLTDSTYVDAGVSLSNLFTIITYLYSYLPESFFLAGYIVGYQRLDSETTVITDPRGETSLRLLPSGTGIFNSGLFTMRSPREFLFGYHDRIFDLVPQDFASIEFSYNGILGFQYSSVDQQRNVTNTPLIYGQRSGKKGLKSIGEYILWRNATTLLTRDTVEGKEPDSSFGCTTWESQGYESCNIWGGPFGPRGYSFNRVDPFRQRKEKKNYQIWTTEIMRPTAIEFEKDTTVRGIKGYRYRVRDSFLRTANCTLDSQCNPDNAFYRVHGPSYIFPMSTNAGGTRISVSFPVFGYMDEIYRSQTEGLPEFQESEHSVYVVVEPYTGFFIKGHLRLQYNYDLDDRQLTSALWTNLFSNPNITDHILYWPFLWFDDTDSISKATARKFRKSVYLSQNLAIAFTAILIALGLSLLVAAFVLYRQSQQETAIDTKDYSTGSHKNGKGVIEFSKIDEKEQQIPSDDDLHAAVQQNATAVLEKDIQ